MPACPSRLYKIPQVAITAVLLAATGIAVWSGCRSTPVTGRKQLLIVSESQEIAMGVNAYREILSSEKLSTNRRYVDMVNRVGRRIAAVADRPDYQWEFNVIASPQQNAFALPGGQVAVYEGIIPICQNEAGLAVVMSHEVAHALARHGGERMSHSTIQSGLQKGLDFVARNQEEGQKKIIMAAYGITSEYAAIRPFSRVQESEADHIGLILMAKAGYDPQEAPRFWERFAEAGQGRKHPEFLSTHPSDEHRAADLRALLPEATEQFEKATARYGLGEPISSR